jgi:hypothetical protein
MGAAILYHEVVVSSTAEPLLVFAAFFLLGLIPATRADEGAGSLNFKDWLREWLSKDESPPSHKSQEDK